jgi:hypothetical protein
MFSLAYAVETSPFLQINGSKLGTFGGVVTANNPSGVAGRVNHGELGLLPSSDVLSIGEIIKSIKDESSNIPSIVIGLVNSTIHTQNVTLII